MKTRTRILYILLLLLLLNGIFTFWKLRLDTTAEKRFTLTDETCRILDNINHTVTLDFYVSRNVAGVPPSLQSYCDYVDELLDEYSRKGHGKLNIQRHDPIPGSATEEQAMRSGMIFQELRPGDLSSRFCIGICFRQLGRPDVSLRQLNPADQNGLEYEITQALLKISNEKPPKIGVMSRLPVFGRIDLEQQLAEWAAMTALKECNFQVAPLPSQLNAIPDDTDILLLIHPAEPSAETLKAIDAFIQRGGRLLAFLDSCNWTEMMLSRNSQTAQVGNTSSSLGNLAEAWGVTFHKNKAVLDKTLATIVLNRNSVPENHIEWLSLNKDCLSRASSITAYLNHGELFLSGSFTWKPLEGVTVTPLISSSPNAQLVDTSKALRLQAALEKAYRPDNHTHCLALSLEGGIPSLTTPGQHSKPTRIMLFADADCLHDNFIKTRSTDNLQLLLNSLDALRSSNDGLIGLRNRSFVNRTLTRLEKQSQDDQKAYQVILDQFQKERNDLGAEVKKLEAESQGGLFSDVQAQKLRAMYDKIMEADRELRRLQIQSGQSMESRRQTIIFWNILLGPGLLLLLLVGIPTLSLCRSDWKRAVRIGAITATAIILAVGALLAIRHFGSAEEIQTAVRGSQRLIAGTMNRDALTSIELKQADHTVRLQKTDNGWLLPDCLGFPADLKMISQLLESVNVCTGTPADIPQAELAEIGLDKAGLCSVTFQYSTGQAVVLGFGGWKRNYRNEALGRYLLDENGSPMLASYLFPEVGRPETGWLEKRLPGFSDKTRRITRVSEFKELAWCLEGHDGGYELQGKVPRGFIINESIIRNIIENFRAMAVTDVTERNTNFTQKITLQLVGDDDILYEYAIGTVGPKCYARLNSARSALHDEKAAKIMETYGKYDLEINGKLAMAFLRTRRDLFQLRQ